MQKNFLPLIAIIFIACFSAIAFAESTLPTKKQTSLELYLTAKEAYIEWSNNPEGVKIVDVRTPGEYIFVGHAPMAHNIPSKFLMYEYDKKKKKPAMRDNQDFLATIKKKFKPADTIMMMCRSGSRSSKAVNKLAEAGYKNVYSITDGFEGDVIKDQESPLNGKRMKNGWRNSGNSWTYELDPDLMYIGTTGN